nr:hypothetical protein BaRGS_031170 [Batillaria attramentaria]
MSCNSASLGQHPKERMMVVEAEDVDEEEEGGDGEEAAAGEEETPAAEEPAATEEPAAAAAGDQAATEEQSAENGEGPGGDAPAEGEEDAEMPDELGEEFKTIDETSQDDEGQVLRSRSPPIRKVEMDDCAWETVTSFQLDRYNCDLNLRIKDEGVKAHPLTVEGFAFMWAGARAMFGVKSGKVAYEVKLLENLNVDHLPSDETNPHVLRVGWSVDDSSLQLGEEALSYGYGGTGKASTECQFKDYGESFTAGDVITAYLDLDSDPVVMSYSKNGTDLGTCFEVEKEKLEDKALFPHILTKNTEFECNFGAKIIMMVGLPGAGKTYWAEKHAAGNPDKKYVVLGTNNIIDKMKVMGLPRKKNYSGRWDVLIDKATKCLNRMIEIAARKKHNYILDQTNVYASARRRKMQPFEGFQRKAVVVVPTEEEFKSRVEKREKEEGKEIPENAVLEMKANFTLPEVGQLFDTVEFTEEEHVSKEEADKLVEKYKKEARDLLPPPEKRFRDSRYGDRGRRDYRDYRPRGGYRGGFDRDRRGGGGGGYRGGGYGGRGGYVDRGGRGRYDNRSRYDDRRSYGSGGGGYGGGSGGYGAGGYRSGGGYQGQRSGSGYYGGGGGGGYNKGWGNQGSWGNQGNWGSQQGQWGGSSGYNQGYGSNWNQGAGNWGGQPSYWSGGSGTGGGYGGNSNWGGNYSGYKSYK